MSCAIIYLVISAVWQAPGSVILASGQVQITDVKVLERGDDWQCPSTEERERARDEIHQIANSAIASTNMCGTSSWRRVGFINMTDASYSCPSGLSLTSYSKRTCGRSHAGLFGCSSTTFSVGGIPYSWVCGRIRGYQFASTSAFGHSSQNIDSHYVDGISLSYGVAGSREHIWTFAAGLTEATSQWPNEQCPCDTPDFNHSIPAFVGNDYFCESGLHSNWIDNYFMEFHSNDILWDGLGCTSTSTCCQLNNPPWFTKNLHNATTDDIELRICTSNLSSHEDIPLELIELYVQ